MLTLGRQICGKWLSSKAFQKPISVIIKNKNISLETTQIIRQINFFKSVDAEHLWKGITSVSNAGKKRGRGRGADRKFKKNLNVGQKIGLGKDRMVWPGLTDSVVYKKMMKMNIQKLPEKVEDVPAPSQPVVKRKRFYCHPLERGWTARSIRGKKLGPPDPVGDVTYESFECVQIENRLVVNMTSIFGRKRKFVSTVLTGNKNGLIGMGRATCLDQKASLRLSKNRAIKKLVVIDLIDSTSVNHDFFCAFGNTRIFVYKKPEGYGLDCQRVIKVCCELLGIRNIHARIEGSVNYKHIVKAFLLGLLNQKTYQEIADETKLHLVEFRKERFDFPEVLASPKISQSESEEKKNRIGFNEYIMGNRVIYQKPKKVPFYQKLPSWDKYLGRTNYKRNHNEVKTKLLAEYGEYRSFLTRVYPECKATTSANITKGQNAE